MKRTVLVVDDEQNMQVVMRMSEAVFSPMHLTCIGAAERPHTEVRARLRRSREVAPWTAGKGE